MATGTMNARTKGPSTELARLMLAQTAQYSSAVFDRDGGAMGGGCFMAAAGLASAAQWYPSELSCGRAFQV
jgi:hypothetical protein